TIGADGMTAAGLTALKLNAGSGNNMLTIDGGITPLDTSLGQGGANITLTANNNSMVNLLASQSLAAVNLNASSRVNLAPGGDRVLRVGALYVSPSAILDLADNDLILQSTPAARDADLANITALIKTARNAISGAWTSKGITSSAAASNAQG